MLTKSSSPIYYVFISLGIITAVLLGIIISQGGQKYLILFIEIVIFILLGLAVIIRPYFGIAITLASQPLTELLPSIPYMSSVLTIYGLLTIVGYLLSNSRFNHPVYEKIPGIFWILSAYILWIIVSNPSAAYERGEDGRIWIFTLIQLWLLVWLTYKLLDTPQKIKVVMGAFVIAALVSAIYSIPRGFVGETISESVRIAGLAGGANTAARYFIVAIAFISYLRSENKYFLMRLLLLIAIGILLYGTILTLSRTGLLLLAGLISMSFVFQRANKNRLQVIIIIVVAIAVIWTYAENLLGILSTILPSVVEGSDTVGLRYGLWQAGLRMWADHPILGVGMGRYVENLATYGWDLIPPHRLQLTAHNMYIAVLAETGLVGLGIFLAALIQNIADLRHSGANEEKTLSSLSHTWLIVFLLLLLGGVTKTDQIDKLLWISIGIPLAIRQIGTKTA